MPKVNIKKKNPREIIEAFFPVISLIWFELIFAQGVWGKIPKETIPHIILPSIYYGAPFVLLLFFLRGKARGIVRSVIALLMMIPFGVEYFINMQFKTLYDVNTVFNGGNDAMNGFQKDIKELLTSRAGIIFIILLLLPFVISLILTFIGKTGKMLPEWLVLFCVVLFLYGIAGNQILIKTNPVSKAAYKDEYSFPKAVERFGLMEGLRLDIVNNAVGDAELEFSGSSISADFVLPTSTPTPTVIPSPTPSPEPTKPLATPTPTPSLTPVPQPQVMDLDFEAMAEDSSGTIKSLNEYCAGLTPSMTNEYTGLFKGKNLIMITAEAFTAEVIDPVRTPTLYRMATKGINFNDFYLPATAGTTGGEFSHIFGLLPTAGGSSVPKMTSNDNTYLTMGQRLNALGYYGMAFHNNDYTYYSRNTTHNRLGYSEGFIGWGNGLEDYVDPVWPESDVQMFEATVPMYIDHAPFNIYYMTVSGHSNYSRGANEMSKKHWEETADMEETSSSRVRAYIAANLELEDSMAYLLSELEAHDLLDDTVIVICADHYPYGLDKDAGPGHMPYLSELYGYEVTNYIERDHNRAIIWSGCLEDMDPIIVDSPSSSIDILPTLLNLFGVEWDSRLLPGRDVLSDAFPVAFNLNYDWKTDLGTYISSKGVFTPVSEDIEIPEGYVDYVKAIVKDKITFCKGVINAKYYAYVFPPDEWLYIDDQ